jgi:hypothetical protein
MNRTCWFITKWQYATVGIETVINAGELFEVASNPMWFA